MILVVNYHMLMSLAAVNFLYFYYNISEKNLKNKLKFF